MKFINRIPFKLETIFEENNIDLELYKEFHISKVYISYKYSEIYLFGKVFDSICYLWFVKDKLTTIEYRFSKQYLQLFIDSINEEFPEGIKLGVDPFMPNYKYYVFHNRVAVHLIELEGNYFILKISTNPSLPRVKKY